MQIFLPDGVGTGTPHAARDAGTGTYDTLVLRERANQWRTEAARMTLEPMREFCLSEAEKCEQRLMRSAYTPVIHVAEPSNQQETNQQQSIRHP